MNHNLAVPYRDKPSPPQTSYLAFFSRQSEDMLFDGDNIGGEGGEIVIRCQAGLRSVSLRWSLHRNMILRPFREGAAGALPWNGYEIRLDPKGLPPGFYDLRVSLDTGAESPSEAEKRPVEGICTFGWRADEMALQETKPADFDEFWENAKEEIGGVPLDPREETAWESYGPEQIAAYNSKHACLPGDYDPSGHQFAEVESTKVSFAGPNGGRVYGWLARPVAAAGTKFPAMLVLPGAGFAARPRPLEHARHGYLALDIQIHGQDVDLAEYESLSGYHDEQVYEPPAEYYFYRVHLRVLQAINYLAARPDVDSSRIVVVGGSQGGRLGIVAAGLDRRVKAVVSCIPNSPNFPHLAWVSRCNGLNGPGEARGSRETEDEAMSDGMEMQGAPPQPETAAARGFAYFDPMNFAPKIQCPVLMNAGLIDPVSPAYSVWSVYQRLRSNSKKMVALPGLGHDWSAEFDRRAWRWLEEQVPKEI